MGLKWDELARRWADKCEVCGEDDQRLVSFSICIDCRAYFDLLKKRKKEKEIK